MEANPEEEIQVVEVVNTDEIEENENELKINSLNKTIDFLRELLKAKDDIIKQWGTEKCYRDTKIANLEAVVAEKDKCIQNLMKQVDQL